VSRARRPAGPCDKGLTRARLRHRPLDSAAHTAIAGFADLLDRCGYRREDVANALNTAAHSVPTATLSAPASSRTLTDDAAHIITLWHMISGYVDGTGEPIPLPAGGPAPSIEALLHLSDRDLTLDSAMDYLRRTKAVRKMGAKFVPRSRYVRHPTGTRTQAEHHLRVVTGLMQTATHNSSAPPRQRWVQAAADGVISHTRRRAFQQEIHAIGMEMLKSADALMIRSQNSKRESAANTPMTIGVYVSEGPPARPFIRGNSDTDQSNASRRKSR
jgi:hypothetical protein